MEDNSNAEAQLDLAQVLKKAFERAKGEHNVSRRSVATAIFARQDAAYGLRKRNAPQHALSALPSPPRTVHSWENLFMRWFSGEDFPIKTDLQEVLNTLESQAPGSTDHRSRSEWSRLWQAGPTQSDSDATEDHDDHDLSPEPGSPPAGAINRAGRDVVIHGGQYNNPGDLTIVHKRAGRRRKD